MVRWGQEKLLVPVSLLKPKQTRKPRGRRRRLRSAQQGGSSPQTGTTQRERHPQVPVPRVITFLHLALLMPLSEPDLSSGHPQALSASQGHSTPKPSLCRAPYPGHSGHGPQHLTPAPQGSHSPSPGPATSSQVWAGTSLLSPSSHGSLAQHTRPSPTVPASGKPSQLTAKEPPITPRAGDIPPRLRLTALSLPLLGPAI